MQPIRRIILLIGILIYFPCSAATNNDTAEPLSTSTQFYLSSNTSCEQYTGTWQGFAVSSNGPVDGGPYTVTLNLYQHQGNIVGQLDNPPPMLNHPIWMSCSQGRLADIFIGEQGGCGTVSQQGGLTTGNMLVLQLRWETAMSGGEYWVFAAKQNASFDGKIPSQLTISNISSCH